MLTGKSNRSTPPAPQTKEKLRYQAAGVLSLSLGGHRCPSAGPSPTKGGSHKPTHDPTQSVHQRWTPFPAYTSHFSFLLFPPSHKLSGLFLISSPPRFEFNRRRVVRCHDFPSSWVLLLRRFPDISTSNTVFLPLCLTAHTSPQAANHPFPALLRGLLLQRLPRLLL